MKKKLTTVAFHGTPEQEEKLIAVIDAHKDAKGAMMPILQGAQEIYGYLPVEVQRIIALRTGVSLEEILSEEAQLDSALIGHAFARSPEDQILARERECDFISTFSRYLSDFERKILSDYLHGLSYAEIAERRSRSPKSVDNAVQRIRKKLARHLNSGDFSD